MRRTGVFTFRVSTDERRVLAALAERLQRSQGDVIRWLIRESARELAIEINRERTRLVADGRDGAMTA